MEVYCEHSQGHLVVACDGRGALSRAFDTLNNVSTKAPYFDIIEGIHYLRSKIKCAMLPVHVKGHQDDQNKKKIDRLGVLNI